MDRRINKMNEAFIAAERIVNMVEWAGFDLTDPNSIINYASMSAMPDNMEYSYGASRLVIWDNDYCDYVIKIPMIEKYEKFCQHEVEVYAAAVKEGLEDSFAWCMQYSQPYGSDDDYVPGIYVMEYADCNEDVNIDEVWKYGYSQYCKERGLDSSSYEYADDYNEWSYDGVDEDLTLEFIESQLSEEQRKAFNVFMMKWWITDIHTMNIGYVGSRAVIIDYAGWNW